MAASMTGVGHDRFKFRTQIFAHEADVRCIVAASNTLISASRDKSTKVFKEADDGQQFSQVCCLKGHDKFVSSVCVVPQLSSGDPSDSGDKFLVYTGSNDKTILMYQPPEEQALCRLEGHTDTVSCLAPGQGGMLISGSWDTTIKVWLKDKCVMTLKGHELAVWAVAAVSSHGLILSASADKTVRSWQAGKMKHVFKGHTDCVRGLALLSDPSHFLSCGNDATIRRWDLASGECVQVYYGHTNFIYSLSVFPNGVDFVSSGEDRTVRVWCGGQLQQTLTLPTQSVWSVCCLGSGDIAAACNDGAIRIFSRHLDRQADPELQQQYEQQLASFAVPSKGGELGEIKVDDLPSEDALLQPGKRDGQTTMIRRPGNLVEAYQWNAGSEEWMKIGEVVGSAGASQATSGKQLYQGKEYDYVFDVELDIDRPSLKLPYNVTEDPWFAAHNFLEKNELPAVYLDQVANFITTNTAGVTLGTGAAGGPSDPFTGSGRYIPGSTASTPSTNGGTTYGSDPFTGGGSYNPEARAPGGGGSNKYFPKTTYYTFTSANLPAITAKLKEFNEQVEESVRLSEVEVECLCLAGRQGAEASSIQAELLMTALTKLCGWPTDQLFPGLDLLRLCLLLPPVSELALPSLLPLLLPHLEASALPNNKMLVLRALANSVASGGAARDVMLHHLRHIVKVAAVTVSDNSNKNVSTALASLLMNFATALYGTSREEEKCACVCVCGELLGLATCHHPETLFRLLVATGTLCWGSDEAVAVAQSIDLPSVVSSISSDGQEEKLRECATHLTRILSPHNNTHL